MNQSFSGRLILILTFVMGATSQEALSTWIQANRALVKSTAARASIPRRSGLLGPAKRLPASTAAAPPDEESDLRPPGA